MQVDTVAIDYHSTRVSDTHHIDFKRVLFGQLMLLFSDLIEQVATDQAHTRNKYVQHLILRQEERIVDYVQCLAQAIERDNERDVGLRGTLRARDHIDTVTAQCIEQLTCHSRSMFHIFTNDRHSRQVVHSDNVVDLTLRDLLRELACQLLDRLNPIRLIDTDRSGILRGSLRHEIDADTRLGQRAEDSMIDTDNTHHTKTLDRKQAGIVDRRDTLNATLVRAMFVRDERTRCLGIERIADTDRNILVINGEDRRRIDHLCTEVTQLGCFGKGQVIDHISRVNHTRIGRHKSIDIGPDLQHIGIESCRHDSRRVVRATATEVRYVATIAVRRDETAHHGTLRQFGKRLTDSLVGLLEIDDMLIVVVRRADNRARVLQLCPINHRSNDSR